MAKVSMHLGFTFRVGDLSTNQYGRIDYSIDQIDTELPIDDQLGDVERITDKVWEVLKSKVDDQLEGLLDGGK
jgi:hypothetical protein